MKLALNGATIMRSPLDADVEIAAECGYDALEIWAGKLEAYTRTRPLEQLAAKMRALSVQPWCINSIEDITFRDGAGRAAVRAEVRRLSAAARILGAPSIVVVPGRRDGGYARSEAVAEAVEALRGMSEEAGETTLAFEFLGKPGCSVPTLEMALEVVERVDRPNVGMVIDTFHFYAGGSDVADLDRVPPEQLVVLHLNGCEDRPRSELTDAHRLYPGEGVLPSAEILRRLRARGFDGVCSVEIFRLEYWEQDARAVAGTARAKAAAELQKAGWDNNG